MHREGEKAQYLCVNELDESNIAERSQFRKQFVYYMLVFIKIVGVALLHFNKK